MCMKIVFRNSEVVKFWGEPLIAGGGGGGGNAPGVCAPPPPPPKIGKNIIFGRKIVIFHTKYPKNFRASPLSAQFF